MNEFQIILFKLLGNESLFFVSVFRISPFLKQLIFDLYALHICGFVRPTHIHIIILHENPIQLHVSRQNSCDDCTIRLWVNKRKC